MKAVRIHRFGGLDAMSYEDVPRPSAGLDQLLIRVKAAGIGPWDAWVREGKSALSQSLPLTLGSDLSGLVETVGAGVTGFQPGDEVFGVTNAHFTGAYAEYAPAEAGMIARKPRRSSHVEAASVPVVASTAWQMVFDHGHVDHGTRVLVHGGAGNVGAYAVQLARRAGGEVIATAYTKDVDFVRGLGASQVIDTSKSRFEDAVHNVDVVLDTIGGEILDRSFPTLKAGGILISSAARPDPAKAARYSVKDVFFLVNVTTTGLTAVADLIEAGQIRTNVGDVLPLSQARTAHEMLAGKPHKRGKIVLQVP